MFGFRHSWIQVLSSVPRILLSLSSGCLCIGFMPKQVLPTKVADSVHRSSRFSSCQWSPSRKEHLVGLPRVT